MKRRNIVTQDAKVYGVVPVSEIFNISNNKLKATKEPLHTDLSCMKNKSNLIQTIILS